MALSYYSSLVTSGLMCDSQVASSSRKEIPWAFENLGPRRGSLPTLVETAFPPDYMSTNDTMGSGESYYFTLQPRRTAQEYRSFLSLDLAESQSMRSGSTRSRDAKLSKSRSPQHMKSFVSFSEIHPTDPAVSLLPKIEERRTAPSSRNSQESLRSIPCPKPVPSSTLPPVPQRTPSERSISPMCFSTLPPSPAIRPSVVAPTDASTIASSRYRRSKRVAALARLEGRGGSMGSSSSRPANFMSMSDDEDDIEEEGDDDMDIDADDELPTPELEIDPWQPTILNSTPYIFPTPRGSLWNHQIRTEYETMMWSQSSALGLDFSDTTNDDSNFIDFGDLESRDISLKSISEVPCSA